MEQIRIKSEGRHEVRLKDYDYATPGAYFVTVCTNSNQALFGEILNGRMMLNEAGQMLESWWHKIVEKFPGVQLDSHVIMPNHLHGIILIVGADPCVRPGKEPESGAGENAGEGAHMGAPLHKIVQWFKTMTTNEYIRGVQELGWRPFDKHMWQRSFYEHVVRRTDKMIRIRKYILNNPLRWEIDRQNPEMIGK